jgi:hypothetical protein
MKKRQGKFTKAALAAAMLSAAPYAATVSAAPLVAAGDIVRLYNGPGSTGGGEFWADVVGKGVGGTINAANYDFIAFCLEYNETFNYYGQDLKVDKVNTAAVNGGVSGGNPDPLSAQTAWLYTQFVNNTLSGYTHTDSKANSLQRAFWFMEGELGASYTLAQLNTLDHQAKLWVDAANASGWTDIGQVRALNLLKFQNGQWVNAQDQLYMLPVAVPEPMTTAMLGLGLALFGFAARRRTKQRP